MLRRASNAFVQTWTLFQHSRKLRTCSIFRPCEITVRFPVMSNACPQLNLISQPYRFRPSRHHVAESRPGMVAMEGVLQGAPPPQYYTGERPSNPQPERHCVHNGPGSAAQEDVNFQAQHIGLQKPAPLPPEWVTRRAYHAF